MNTDQPTPATPKQPVPSEADKKLSQFRLRLNCLYLATDERVAHDVEESFEEYVAASETALAAARRETEEAKAQIVELRSHLKEAMNIIESVREGDTVDSFTTQPWELALSRIDASYTGLTVVSRERLEALEKALEGLLGCGRKDLSNPKYDCHFATALAARAGNKA